MIQADGMEDSNYFKNYVDHYNFKSEKYGKSALFENEHLFVGMNCMEPGQAMEKHAHDDQCRFYLVLSGNAHVWVGNEEKTISEGTVIWFPPHHLHKIVNEGSSRLVLLVGFNNF
jgi:quercetin dioxygenase-like cupin family protein